MKISLKFQEVPFLVGDTVWIAQPYEVTEQTSYFQGEIIQIILDGSLMSTSAVRLRAENYELVMSQVIYDIKPLGDHAGMPRVSVNVALSPGQKTLFRTRAELLVHQDEAEEWIS
ncbi:hypothetical protein GCM10023189_11060 [Nibrella saemangeumensis]|uniref:Uncharacterized protein n=1 Tax=Nibrella saemangeumensis TaxID=1084526 RepID=A0ABP8MJF0_9BACT